MKWFILISAVLVLTLVCLAGCSKQAVQPQGGVSAPPSTAASNVSAPVGTDVEMASCPVLGTTMPKSDMIPVEYKGSTYYLCCQDCVPKFNADPEKYIGNPATPLPASEGMKH